ncbi:protein-tyrosine phosphatase family protein [Providencia alcalifaciens]|uniref:protein-tyrosine phosphatase family protein n=1 Tax=Providencia alcalifaciens TaxID=126385 RepID=UPI001CC7ADF0|nr:protein-tyrosine phosphatase family protein [Providencia alcalifaciens]CAG9435375.1 Secreted effector protein SptP [Providencia alcalifaciens]CAG9435672.1 Secreted effector protein SptP [Providencia alcalifaciens]CAG9435687.1 Secreted effector protein SptP [Providencia alcalifaciens]CAG9435690.1 Secreted effector protein SptP [Providencia alcalifaciens]CAG9435998.1 Secreted effector protein SptP [Providencia alcalifaciens]
MQNINLSNFTHISGSQNARLVVSNHTTEPTIVTASEGFSGRVLSFLGRFPLFQRINAVRTHIERTQIENKIAVTAFAEALANSYGTNASNKIIEHYNLNSGNIPLTQRKVQAILIPTAERIQAKEAFITALSQKYGVNIAHQALMLTNFITHNTDKNDLNAGIIVTTNASHSHNAVDELAQNLQQAILTSTISSLNRLEGLQNISGKELRTNFSKLSEGNGGLRTLQTLLTNLDNLPNIPGMNRFQDIIKNIIVGNVPFSQWGTTGGSVEAWVKTASHNELTLAAERICAIVKEVLGLKDKLLAHQNGRSVNIEMPKLNLPRFNNIPVAAETQVILQDKTPMPANIVLTGGQPAAIACSYPKGSLSGMESHLRMILEQKPSCLVVLTGDDQINAKKLPDYFRQSGTIGAVTTQATQETSVITPSGVEIDKYTLNISSETDTHSLPVIHVQSWKDHQALRSPQQLLELAKVTIEASTSNEAIYENIETPVKVPMVHCFGGVGRTGTLITAMEMLKNPNTSHEQIIADLRNTRNPKMVEDRPQQQQLRQLEYMLTSGALTSVRL